MRSGIGDYIMKKKDTFKIGELSKLFDIGVDSIRYYEKVGILHPVRNDENNYRMYTIDDVRRLALIRELLGLSFSTDRYVNMTRTEMSKVPQNCCKRSLMWSTLKLPSSKPQGTASRTALTPSRLSEV